MKGKTLLIVCSILPFLISCEGSTSPESPEAEGYYSLQKAKWGDAGLASDGTTILDTVKLVYGPDWARSDLDVTYVLDSLQIPNTMIGSSGWSYLFAFLESSCILKEKDGQFPIILQMPYEIRMKNDMVWVKVTFHDGQFITINECSLVFVGVKGVSQYSGTTFTWFSDPDSEVMYGTYAWHGITKHPVTMLSARPFYKF